MSPSLAVHPSVAFTRRWKSIRSRPHGKAAFLPALPDPAVGFLQARLTPVGSSAPPHQQARREHRQESARQPQVRTRYCPQERRCQMVLARQRPQAPARRSPRESRPRRGVHQPGSADRPEARRPEALRSEHLLVERSLWRRRSPAQAGTAAASACQSEWRARDSV